jgi:DNA-3-methyladenine glycosylase II
MTRPTKLELEYTPPLDWAFFLRYLGARSSPGVEAVEDQRYIRTFLAEHRAGTLSVSHHPTAARLVVTLDVPTDIGAIIRRVRRMFDLDADLDSIHRSLRTDRRLKSLLDDSPGVRIPGAWSAFELLVRTIVGQQVTVKAATTIMGRIVERFGTPLAGPARERPAFLFPSTEAIAQGHIDSIGMPTRRVAALQNVARAIAAKRIPFSDSGEEDTGVREALLGLPGIGPWTVEYFALRALRDPDAWPGTDLVLHRAMERHGCTAARWQPYRGYAAMHLWNEASLKGSRTEKP